MTVKAIVAVDEKWGIGKKNGLLFSIPQDMRFFKEKTMGKTVCMGYNTLLSFPDGKPLKGRKNIVICPKGVKRDDVVVVYTMDEMLSEIKKEDGEVFVIGGAMFYKSMLPYCDEVFVTKVSADGNAEVFYENLDDSASFDCVFESEPIIDGGYEIKFTTYKNKSTSVL